MMHSCSERRMIWTLCLIFSLSYSILVFASPFRPSCRSDQKDALQEFKNEFNVPKKALSKTGSWRNNTDCCSWDGVTCDPKTSNVVELNLTVGNLNGPLRFNSSLFRLQHLQSLYLSHNNLSGVLPDSISNLKYLRLLRLDNCSFFGKISSSLGNLSYLIDLSLFNNDFTGELPDSIGNLKRLTELRVGSNELSGNFPRMLLNLSELTVISFGSNQFKGMLPSNMSCLSKLESFDIIGNSFYGSIPSSLFMIPSLVYLDLSVNEFTGELPDSIGNLKRLTDLQLEGNKLCGNFPVMLLNFSELTYISLESNQFEGMLPSNMSCLSKLESFYISENSFYGSVPSSLFMIPSLLYLDLSRNDFSGPLEIVNISSPSIIENLLLGENNFSGPIPGFISKLVGLRSLDLSFWNPERGILSYMNTRSMVDVSVFSHLRSLRRLDLSGNNLKINSTLHLPSTIYFLFLNSCNLSKFPDFIQQTRLVYLDISANKIEGQVPEWLWRLPKLCYANISHNSFSGFEGSADALQNSALIILDISSNKFEGPLPLLPNSMEYIISSENWFSGEIPRAICKLVSLRTLVLSNNNFSGSIPRCFENFNTNLLVLHLRNNSLSGVIPEESVNGLISLDVGHNQLSGELPKSLINCTYLEFLNVEGNKFNGTFPFGLGLLPNLQILVLRFNEFHGPISSPGDSLSFPKLRMFDISQNRFTGILPSDYFSAWSAMSSDYSAGWSSMPLVIRSIIFGYYQNSVGLTNKGLYMDLVGSGFTMYKTIDVSRNRFEGDIPKSIGFLKELIVLNMSNNAFTSRIPPSLSNLTKLESLDLSQNILSGKIPPELGKLTFLARMNFSYNMLEGPIPQGTQIQSQNISSFAENPGLCGAPLQETCRGGEEEEATKQTEDEEKDQVLSWVAAAIGYVPGVFCGFTIGHILTSYKHDWFLRIVYSFT